MNKKLIITLSILGIAIIGVLTFLIVQIASLDLFTEKTETQKSYVIESGQDITSDEADKTEKPYKKEESVSDNEDQKTEYNSVVKKYSYSDGYFVFDPIKEVFNDSYTGKTLPYTVYLPRGYKSNKQYPVLLFLHGAGEMGSDNTSHLNNINIALVSCSDILSEAIIICPQCPDSGWWSLYEGNEQKGYLAAAKRLTDNLVKKYNGDKNRIYVTGLSMGGYGTWQLLEHYSDYFAAAAPICGWGNTNAGHILKDIPIWIFHGTADDTVSFSSSQQMYNAIIGSGGNKILFTKLQGVGHNAWTPAYSDRKLFSWMFSQNKKTYQSKKYTYKSLFSVKSPDGTVLVDENDVEGAFLASDSDIIELILTDNATKKLKKSYKKHKNGIFSVYYCGKKLYDYKVLKVPENNEFFIEKVLDDENTKSLQRALSVISN